VAGAWLVHLYTASGALLAFLALTRIVEDRYRDAFGWLCLAVLVDATDGMLARRADVAARLPRFSGAKLDEMVDYLTYVFVPAFIVWHVPLVPPSWTIPVAFAILLSSAYGFNRDDAKTPDHFFTGFPSYWNILVLYLYVAGWPTPVGTAVLLAAATLVFLPIRYVYPSRTAAARSTTMALGVVWGILMVAMVWMLPDVPRALLWGSFIFPAYYLGLSFFLEYRRHHATSP
jgi:phosphatidylcholine synthase